MKKIKCDLHGFRLFDAIEEIISVIACCMSSGDFDIFIIHGYRHGQVLKNYFRSSKFLEDISDVGYHLRKVNNPNPGASKFKII